MQISVENCKIHQKFLLALVANKIPVEEAEFYRRLETPLIFAFQQLTANEEMSRLPCIDCPAMNGLKTDKGTITVWTLQTEPPKPVVDCTSTTCDNVLPSHFKRVS